jgi:hypothetical protein
MLKEIQLAGSVRTPRSESLTGTGGAENTPGTIAKSPHPMNTNDELTDSEIDAIADRGDELLSHSDNYCEAINAFF